MSGENKPPFDAGLPVPYSGEWKEARGGETPRYTAYQPPGGAAVAFIQKSFDFSGGQSVDTAEYPFGGLWSNERLNEKPQTLAVEGFLRGADYIAKRAALVGALRVPTDDAAPGYLDLPFWGRFPVVVVEYRVSEKTDEQGQCSVSLTLQRAGMGAAGRSVETGGAASHATVAEAGERLKEAAVADYAAALEGKADPVTLFEAFMKIKGTLINIAGRVRGAKAAIDRMVSEINGITNLINEVVRAPGELARALLNAVAGVVAGILEIARSLGLAGDGDGEGGGAASGTYPPPDNNSVQNALAAFLSASGYALDLPAVTVREQATKEATENLYRIAALGAAGILLVEFAGGENGAARPSYQKAAAYLKLLEKLDGSIGKENPVIYAAVEGIRAAVSQGLREKELSAELRREIPQALPLLTLAQYLGCDEDKIRALNSIADSFVIQGEVVYV